MYFYICILQDTDHFSIPTSQDNSDWESDNNNTSDTEGPHGKDLAFDKEMAKPMIDTLPQDKKTKFTVYPLFYTCTAFNVVYILDSCSSY